MCFLAFTDSSGQTDRSLLTWASSCTAKAASGGPCNSMLALYCCQMHHLENLLVLLCHEGCHSCVVSTPEGGGGAPPHKHEFRGPSRRPWNSCCCGATSLGPAMLLAWVPDLCHNRLSNHLTAYFALCIMILQSFCRTMTQDKTIFSCRSHIGASTKIIAIPGCGGKDNSNADELDLHQ